MSWQGFYQFVESVMNVNMWNYVDNPGGVWNLSLNWEYWINFPVYIQIEQGKLCYKVAIEEGEADLGEGVADVGAVQAFLLDTLLKVAVKEGYSAVRRPSRLSWNFGEQ